jgi:yeast amino acid transporter
MLGYAFDYPSKASAGFMQFWTNSVPEAVWIAIFLVVPIVFNLLNVWRYGEIEFGLATTKVTMIVILIVLSILLPIEASPENMLLGTSGDYRPVPCD